RSSSGRRLLRKTPRRSWRPILPDGRSSGQTPITYRRGSGWTLALGQVASQTRRERVGSSRRTWVYVEGLPGRSQRSMAKQIAPVPHELSLAYSPVTLDPHITTAPRRPVSRGPHIARRGRDGPVARHPHVAPASPCPVPRHPDVRGTRSSGNDLHLRWGQRRGRADH